MFKFVFIVFLACANALPTIEKTGENLTEPTKDATDIKKECAKGILNPICLKIGAIRLIKIMNQKSEVALFPGVILVKDREDTKSEAVAAELARSLHSQPEETLDNFLFYVLETFLDTHSVKLRLLDETSVEQARSMVEEGRRRKNGKGGMGGQLMAMALMMKGTMMSIGMGGLAMLAGKALMTAMMSLLLSAIIGIKSLSSGQKSTTYEIVSKPVYSHSHSHSTGHEDVGAYGHSGYGRNLNVRRR